MSIDKNNKLCDVRRFTPDETDMLMGFPIGYTAKMGNDSKRYQGDGNSWAENCARFVIKGIHRENARIEGKDRGLKYGTISSGVECHSLASRGLGDESVFFSEIAPAPSAFLEEVYGNKNLGDMTLIDYDEEKGVITNNPYEGYVPPDEKALGFKPFKTDGIVEIPCKNGEIDLVSGGTPCQSFSVAGKREGGSEGSGTRSSLAFQLPRIGKALGARWLIWENVPGAFSSNGGRDFLWFLYRMQEAGYTLAWRTLDAQYVRTDTHPRAVPQRRRRVWLVGYRGDDWRVPVRALFEPSKVLGYEPPQRVVGKGFTELNPSYVPDAEPYDEEEDIKTFLHYANPKIIERLVEKGLIESPDERLAKLKKEHESKTLGYMEFDLFGGGASEPVHQGRGIRERDLELNLPDESDILNCQFKVYSAAQCISRSVEFCGSLFDHLKDGVEPTVDDLSENVLANIGNSGFMSKNFIVTMKSPEWNAGLPEEDIESLGHNVRDLYDGDVCGLSDILQDIVDEKYYLSWRACWGILNRAGKRGKKLPFELGYALVERIIEHSAFVKWCAMYASDVSKKEGKLSEREIAKICFNDFVTIDATWEEVHEIQPVRSSSDESDEDEDDEMNGLTEFIGLDEDGDDE